MLSVQWMRLNWIRIEPAETADGTCETKYVVDELVKYFMLPSLTVLLPLVTYFRTNF
jgi:hypothetical protein